MTAELRLQKALIDGVKDLGGSGLKMSNRFTSGIPDLLLHLHRTMIVEVKLADLPAHDDTKLQLRSSLTPLQANTLRSWAEAGAAAGVLYCHKGKRDDLALCLRGALNTPTKVEFLSCALTRKWGETWAMVIRRGLLDPL